MSNTQSQNRPVIDVTPPPQFYTTLHSGVDFEPARTIGSYLWCRPYLSLSPETCFVLDEGTGTAVGYIIGTPSTTEFAEKWEREYVPRLKASDADGLFSSHSHHRQSDDNGRPNDEVNSKNKKEEEMVIDLRKQLANAECSMLKGFSALLSQYPAHMHIDILPKYQNRGWGKKMMDVFLSKMKEMGVKGVHLGMVRANEGARRFYERLGWRVCPEVLDGGRSGEVGVGEGGEDLCLVRGL
jgi:ribosomal protein S18 acetylase RimI-like enzyme